ncbi:MAG: hypothetical protein FRX49_13704 [Trebouxia sp. A1-2]|nr:MAG: hypothetical protein FRX49_13704 [Trebouxia sp. A1-2]
MGPVIGSRQGRGDCAPDAESDVYESFNTIALGRVFLPTSTSLFYTEKAALNGRNFQRTRQLTRPTNQWGHQQPGTQTQVKTAHPGFSIYSDGSRNGIKGSTIVCPPGPST